MLPAAWWGQQTNSELDAETRIDLTALLSLPGVVLPDAGQERLEQARHQQIGYMDAGGSVQRSATPAANNVSLLVNTVILNYMALHGEQGRFGDADRFSGHGLGNAALMDRMTAFAPIVSGTIDNPV